MSDGFKNVDGYGDRLPHGVELSESESRTSDECCEVGAGEEFSYPALTMGEEVKGLPTPKYKQRRAQRVGSERERERSSEEQLFERTMSEEEELWDRNLREMEEREERPKRRRRRMVQLALEDGRVEDEQPEEGEGKEREEPSGSTDVPAKGTKRMLALMDRQRVKPTSGTKRIRPTRAPQRDVMLRRIQELQDLAAKAKSARAGLLQQELAKVKANPKIKAKAPKKAKAKEPVAKAKEPVAKAEEPVAKAKEPVAPPKELPKAKDLPAKAMPKVKEPPKTKAKARARTIYPDAPWHRRDDQEWYDYREWSNWKDWKNDRGW